MSSATCQRAAAVGVAVPWATRLLLELVTHHESRHLSLEEIKVCENSPLNGRSLAEAQVRAHYGVIIVAIEQRDGEMEFNPPASHTIHAGDTLVAIGKGSDLKKLEADCSIR